MAYLKIDHVGDQLRARRLAHRGAARRRASPSTRASSSRSSAIPAAASPRCSTSWRACSGRREGGVLLEGREVNAPGPDRAVVFQNHSLLPWLTVLRERGARGRQGFPRAASRKAERRAWIDENLDARAHGARRRQAPARDLGRHEAARRHRPRARHGAEDPPPGRALRGARRAHPRPSPGPGHGDPRAARQHHRHDHPRRRRGGAALRPHRDDDQRPRRDHRRGPRRRPRRARAAASSSSTTTPTTTPARRCWSSSTPATGRPRSRREGSGRWHANGSSSSATAWLSLRFLERLAAHAPGPLRRHGRRGGAEPAYNRVLLSSLLAGEIEEARRAASATAPGTCATASASSPARPSTRSTSRRGRVARRRTSRSCPSTVSSSRPARPRSACRSPAWTCPASSPSATSPTWRRIAGARAGARAVVIGGGLLGLEAAYGLARGRRASRSCTSWTASWSASSTPARRRLLQRRHRAARHRASCSAPTPRGRRARSAPRRCALPTGACSRRTSSSSPSACGRTPLSPRAAGLAVGRGVARGRRASRPSRPASTPSANAPSIGAWSTASSSRPTSRPTSSPAASPASDAAYDGSAARDQPQGLGRARGLRGRSRTETERRADRSRTRGAASTASSSSATDGSSARSSSATPPTGPVPRPHPLRRGRVAVPRTT